MREYCAVLFSSSHNLTTHAGINLWSSENMISGFCFLIVILIVVSNNDALLGSNHPPQPPSKEKIVISTGLYRKEAYVTPVDTVEDLMCLDNAYFFGRSFF